MQKKQGHRSNSCGYTSDSPMDYPGNCGNGFFEAEFSSRRMARSTQRLSGKTSPDPQRSEISFYTNVGEPRVGGGSRNSSRQTLPKTPIPKPQRHLELQFRRWMRLLTLTSYPCQPLSPENPAPLRNPKYTRETGRATPIHQLGIERLSFEDIFMGN